MKERRKSSRVPVKLEVELRRGIWEARLTEDISRRGLFLRMAGTCALRQLLQVRIRLPGEAERLELMARVARRDAPWAALAGGKLPGVGLEFFCMDDTTVARWDRFVAEAEARLEEQPTLNGFQLGRALAEEERRVELPPRSTRGPKTQHQNISNFIYRAQNLEGLARFMNGELREGRFPLNLPYEVPVDSPARLRVIHPMSLEEFILQGNMQPGQGAERYALYFEAVSEPLRSAFQSFVETGLAPSPQEY